MYYTRGSMLPVLLDLKFIKIYTFGVFLVLAFFWSTFLLWKNIRLTSYKEEEIFDGLFISLFGALFIGRLVHVVLHYDKFGLSPLKFLLINGYPGISLYGALLGGLVTFFVFCNSHKIKFFDIVDYLISPLFIALAIGKIGSFFSGVEIGTKTKSFLALKYVNFDGTRHLTAFYEGILFFIGAIVAYKMMFMIRREQIQKGMSFFFFLWYFALVYFLLDGLKASRAQIAGYSMNWIVATAFLLTFTPFLLYHLRYSLIRSVKGFFSLLTTRGRKTERKAH